MAGLVAVIAGTPIDTEMGVEILINAGIKCKGYPISKSPKEQSRLQLLSKDKLYGELLLKIKEGIDDGAEIVFLYCNSLSAAVDMEAVSKEVGIPIVTPFLAYNNYGKKYSSLMVMAANAQSCSKIETILEEANEEIKIWSISTLPLVEEIEKNYLPIEIFNALSLKLILQLAESNKLEGIILGCTHFPYMAEILKENTYIDILDPVDEMIGKLLELLDQI